MSRQFVSASRPSLVSAVVVTGERAVPAEGARWASLPYPILICGERGTGKTELAARLHKASGRQGPFVTGSLAQVPKGMEVPELLGHSRGAFTSAVADRKGLFERAHSGTAFLDELGRASPEAQNALLGFLDHRRLTRVGGVCELILDVRLIAATNSDLEGMVAEGTFLADLLDRFGYYVIRLKPIRERREEILPLVRSVLERESAALGRERPPLLSAKVQRLMVRAPWPGNLRDLVKLCEYLAGTAGEEVDVASLPPRFLATLGIESDAPEEPLAVRARRVLEACGGNKTEAARRLRTSRQHLHRVLRGRPLAPPVD
jgi:DNA-binding NtrC family response regulator